MLLRNGKRTDETLRDKIGDSFGDKLMFFQIISTFLSAIHCCLVALLYIIVNCLVGKMICDLK